MSTELPPFTMYPGGQTGSADGARPGREFQELWFSVARLHWASIVLVPADAGGGAADVATSLAQVGTQLRDTPVTAVVANRIDFSCARALAEFQPRLLQDRRLPAIEVEARPVAVGAPASAPPAVRPVRDATPMPPLGRAIIAIPPVVDEPLGVAVAQAADAVVLCVHLGKTRMPAARRTIELIGADRIVGVVLVR
jgi:hypothetical protein